MSAPAPETHTVVRQRIAELVEAASDGEVTAADALAGAAPLSVLGVGSLGFLRLIDAVEAEFDVAIDPAADPSTWDSVDALARLLALPGL